MNIWYFGLTSLPPTQNAKSTKANICLLDRYQITKDKLSHEIQSQVLNGSKQNQIISSNNADLKLLTHETLCQFEAKKLNVKRLPAIVFNGQYVVYGQRNISQAVKEFKNYQERDHVE